MCKYPCASSRCPKVNRDTLRLPWLRSLPSATSRQWVRGQCVGTSSWQRVTSPSQCLRCGNVLTRGGFSLAAAFGRSQAALAGPPRCREGLFATNACFFPDPAL